MPIDEAILYFCEECHTVSLQGGVCANCENPLQVDFFVPKAELEALRSALAEREAQATEYRQRCLKAIKELKSAFDGNVFDDSPLSYRINGKIQGVKLALSYFDETMKEGK